MDLTESRKLIDKIDSEILELFIKRMEVASDIADYKKANGMEVMQKGRERVVLQNVCKQAGPDMENYARILFTTLLDLSKSYQNSRNSQRDGALHSKIIEALDSTPKIFPKSGVIACQGIEGAYSQIACDKLFKNPDIHYVKTFEDVFNAVDNGICDYGILPIENSIHGTVNAVYDLMRNYQFHIVKSIKLKVNHALMAKAGVEISQIKEIISHEQALGQCSEFLKKYPDIKITVCVNTAVAAKTVGESNRHDIAAISSPDCASYYGLSILDERVANSDSNFTRFICISKKLEIYPGADRVSIIMNLPHIPGSLNSIIMKFATAGLNLTKLESRPIPGKDFEFSFYFDLEASIYSEETISILDELATGENNFVFLGSYVQV
ncbi:MAG: prephenate dehydratase domain-containing protein [Eubacteriales bacterium]|nr:prephenate dehydratase domain-containing protein [Eubacteriales bacterium]